jgi:hypothetical protein
MCGETIILTSAVLVFQVWMSIGGAKQNKNDDWSRCLFKKPGLRTGIDKRLNESF